jgi:hypothetical protein
MDNLKKFIAMAFYFWYGRLVGVFFVVLVFWMILEVFRSGMGHEICHFDIPSMSWKGDC